VREHFVVTAAFGVSRGAYVPVERARNAMLVVAAVRDGS
jgi:hypothetical protein